MQSFAEVIAGAPGKAPAKGRAWANVYLLGSQASEIEGLLRAKKLSKKDQASLDHFASRLLLNAGAASDTH